MTGPIDFVWSFLPCFSLLKALFTCRLKNRFYQKLPISYHSPPSYALNFQPNSKIIIWHMHKVSFLGDSQILWIKIWHIAARVTELLNDAPSSFILCPQLTYQAISHSFFNRFGVMKGWRGTFEYNYLYLHCTRIPAFQLPHLVCTGF